MSVLQTIKNEPAVIVGVVTAAAEVAVSLGYIDNGQKGQIIALASALLTLLGSFVVRANVTPTAKINAAVTVAAAPAEPAEGIDTIDAPAPEPKAPTGETIPVTGPAAVDPNQDPVKAQLVAAIENVRKTANATNDARANAAKNAVNASA